MASTLEEKTVAPRENTTNMEAKKGDLIVDWINSVPPNAVVSSTADARIAFPPPLPEVASPDPLLEIR
jgi:hypothetical protein